MPASGISPRKPPWPAPSLISMFSTPTMRKVFAAKLSGACSGASCGKGKPKKLAGSPNEASSIEALARERRGELVAIGEVGLDHWMVKDEAGRSLQRVLFERFVALAAELDLPLNVHSRSTGRETIAVLLDRGARRVVLHAFDGRASTAAPAVEAGYFFSVPPSVVRSAQKRKLVARLPLACLLLETDSPVLGPEPGVRNEPANLRLSLQAVAEIKGMPEEALAETIAENTRRLFGDRIV